MSQQPLHFVECGTIVNQCACEAVPQIMYAHIIQTQLCANTAPFAEHTAIGFVCAWVDEQPLWFVDVLLVLQQPSIFDYLNSSAVEHHITWVAVLCDCHIPAAAFQVDVLPLSCKHFMPTSSRVHQKANQQTHSIPPMYFYIVPKSCCLSRVQIAFFSVYGSQLCE